ncbi:MAG: OmpA family protein [Pseudomonadota bacterium]
MRMTKTFCAVLAVSMAATMGAPGVSTLGEAKAQSSDADLERLQRQREQLILQRQEEQKRRTLLEISPSTGTTAAAVGAAADQAVVSPSSSGAPKATARAKKKTSTAQQIAKASVPAELAPEDQIFRPIKFAYDSAFLDQTAQTTLSGLCATLKVDLDLNPGSEYYVIGHTDATGAAAYNERLSQRRADATKQYLVGNCGIASTKLTAVGMGEERLLASAGPDDARQRRVEIQVNIAESGS